MIRTRVGYMCGRFSCQACFASQVELDIGSMGSDTACIIGGAPALGGERNETFIGMAGWGIHSVFLLVIVRRGPLHPITDYSLLVATPTRLLVSLFRSCSIGSNATSGGPLDVYCASGFC